MDKPQYILQEQAWDYFKITAAQRLTVLNFYIAISSVIASVQFATLQSNQLSHVGAFLGLLLIFFSYVFWKWDKRTSDMVRIAEEAIKYFENETDFKDKGEVPHVAKIILREEYITNQKKKKKSILFWRNYYTYGTCMRLIFSCFALVGAIGIVLNFI